MLFIKATSNDFGTAGPIWVPGKDGTFSWDASHFSFKSNFNRGSTKILFVLSRNTRVDQNSTPKCLSASSTQHYPSLLCFVDKNRSAEGLSRQVFQLSSNNAVPPVPHVTSKHKSMEFLNITHCSFMTACQSKQGGYLTHTLMRAELHCRISQAQT